MGVGPRPVNRSATSATQSTAEKRASRAIRRVEVRGRPRAVTRSDWEAGSIELGFLDGQWDHRGIGTLAVILKQRPGVPSTHRDERR